MGKGSQKQTAPQPLEGHRLSRIWWLIAFLLISSSGGAASSLLDLSLDTAISIPTPGTSAQNGISAPYEWEKINQSVIEQLSVADLGTVIASLPLSPSPGDLQDSMRRLNLFARAGDRHKVSEVIDRLPVITGPLVHSLLTGAIDFLTQRQEFDLARRMLEKLPQATPFSGNQLVDEWARTGDPVEIDRWLAARMEQNYDYWLLVRLVFRQRRGTAGELVDSLANEVKAHPADLAWAVRYLRAAEYSGKDIRVDWMGETCKPAFAAECFALAYDLANFTKYSRSANASSDAAISLFKQALSLPFTDRDPQLLCEEMLRRRFSNCPLIYNQKDFASLTKFQMASIYQDSGQAEKAQPIIEELAAAYPEGLPSFNLSEFSGRVQAMSGARVIEKRFKQAEAKNTDSARYWYDRAMYYKGRNERADAIEAFEKALKLSLSRSNMGNMTSGGG